MSSQPQLERAKPPTNPRTQLFSVSSSVPEPKESKQSPLAWKAWSQCKSPGPMTCLCRSRVCSSEAGRDKTTTKLLSFRCWWLRLQSATCPSPAHSTGCWRAGAGAPNDTLLQLGVELSCLAPPQHKGPMGLPLSAGHLWRRSLGSWPWAGWQRPRQRASFSLLTSCLLSFCATVMSSDCARGSGEEGSKQNSWGGRLGVIQEHWLLHRVV